MKIIKVKGFKIMSLAMFKLFEVIFPVFFIGIGYWFGKKIQSLIDIITTFW